MESIVLKWTGDMSFEAEVQGFKLQLDAAPDFGGKGKGPRPKPLLLVGLAGCTAMDVVSIAKKMKVEIDDFDVKVSSGLTEEHPKVFTGIHIVYEFWGKDIPLDKINKAIELSQERYCGVSAMLRKAAPITHEVVIHQS